MSDATARRLHNLLRPDVPVHVIPHGIDHERFGPDDRDDGDEQRLADLGVRSPYVAFVGTLEPRKDVATLVEAFDRIAGEHAELSLVVAGGQGWGNDRFDKAVAASPNAARIVRTGYVPDDALPSLYRRADAVVYAALEEGFGLPALEALACGAPTVTTTGSVMDELTGGAAITTPPADAASLADALSTALAGGAAVADRRRRGLDVAAGYTWDATAEAHERVYRDVVSVAEARRARR